jgi:hypothetical protein
MFSLSLVCVLIIVELINFAVAYQRLRLCRLMLLLIHSHINLLYLYFITISQSRMLTAEEVLFDPNK